MSDSSRLERLLGYLEGDPGNFALLADAAKAALDEGALDQARDLLSRHEALAPLPPALRNEAGLVALRQGQLDEARGWFEGLQSDGHDLPAIRFNLAWLAALQGRHAAVLELLDEAVIAEVPRAAAMKVQAMHHLGQVEDAVTLGLGLLEQLPEDNALLGAVSVAAMDSDDFALATRLAARATGGADALTTQGLAALDQGDPQAAMTLFDLALAEHAQAPRALIGKGLSLLAEGAFDAAAPLLELGAGIFGSHLGSWIAVGWTHVLRRDQAAARRAFETVQAQDDSFAEAHGGLAVLDLLEGQVDSGTRRAEIAMRLDRNSLGGALASMILREMQGEPERARQIAERVFSQPIGANGQTLAEALAGLGRGRAKAGGR